MEFLRFYNEKVTDYPKLDNGTSYTDEIHVQFTDAKTNPCLLYTSPSPRD